MPSKRKRIGYLPSVNIQEIISKIANKEKLSQSKIVGILVEEALIARGVYDIRTKNEPESNSSYIIRNQLNNSPLKYNDLDELISDKGITYNIKTHNYKSNDIPGEFIEANNEELFEQFKQFLLFQKLIKKNNNIN